MSYLESEDERATIADLELYGLPIREINILEEHGGLLYVDQLCGESARDLLGLKSFGPRGLNLLRVALSNWQAHFQVKTVEECVLFKRSA
jgi:hypothetical protein